MFGNTQNVTLLKAYFKMQNVLVDDRRIWVDLYVSRMSPYPVTKSNIPALNQWRDSIPVGRMTSNCLPEEALEEAEISSRRKSIAPAVGMGLETSMGWCLKSRNVRALILTRGIVAIHANVEEDQGHTPHAPDRVE